MYCNSIMSLLDSVPILSSAEPSIKVVRGQNPQQLTTENTIGVHSILEEPVNPSAVADSDIIRVKMTLDLNCCPCPKECSDCTCKKCDECLCEKCTCKRCDGYQQESKVEEKSPSFCQRWFPFFSR